MLIPLFLALFSHSKPAPRRAVPHKAAGRQEKPATTAVKGERQFVMLVPAPQFTHPAPSPPRRLMPLTTSLRLDTPAQEQREEEDLVAAINNERTRRGLGPLTEDPLLNVTARSHSQEMCSLSYFDHCSPTSGSETPMDRYLAGLRAGGAGRPEGAGQPEAALVGENIFYASVTDAVYNVAYAHTRLMNSPGHRANILEPRFTKVGVGLYRDSQGRFWVTEMFLREVE